jgi:hypothetical protein
MEINVDDILGPRYVGRRYLRYADLVALGIVGNRGSLALWIRKGQFPAGIKIAGPYGRTLSSGPRSRSPSISSTAALNDRARPLIPAGPVSQLQVQRRCQSANQGKKTMYCHSTAAGQPITPRRIAAATSATLPRAGMRWRCCDRYRTAARRSSSSIRSIAASWTS